MSADVLVLATNCSSPPNPGAWWYAPVLTGIFALIGVLLAQVVVLRIAQRNDRRRSDPELLKQCAAFSSAVGRLKREVSLTPRSVWDLSCLTDLEAAADSILIIGTPEIGDAVDAVISCIPMILSPEDFEHQEERSQRHLFAMHRRFTDEVRRHFGKPPKIYVAVPMIQRPGPPEADAPPNT
ncbi:hypothetical protein [Nocardia sp. NPDC057353]|uniref:hypothetical protein n=1 Tax=Nocardia sp. NPDC057353 TaxID=3346104 RepID=UPI00363634C7